MSDSYEPIEPDMGKLDLMRLLDERNALAAAFCERCRAALFSGARYAEGTCLHCQGDRLEAERDALRAALVELAHRSRYGPVADYLRAYERARAVIDRTGCDHAMGLVRG